MAKATKGMSALPPGFKISETNNRKGVPMFLLFVDNAQGVFEPRKGALARVYTREEAVELASSKDILAKVTKVSRTPTVKAAAKPTQKPANVSRQTPIDEDEEELESID